jgi:selenide,water dikinase
MDSGNVRHVVLVGGGHSHIQVLDAFAESRPPASRLTLVVDRPIAVYSGMVPGFVAGQYRMEDLEIDTTALARRAGAEVVVARAVRLDAEHREIVLAGHEPVSYDIASFDIGSTALPTRPIGDFVRRVAEVVDAARRHNGGRPFRVVVVGGGAGGVELAFTLDKRLRDRAMADVRVVLLEAGPRVLTGYSDSLVRRVIRCAARRGIEIRCNHQVRRVEPDVVQLEHRDAVPYHLLVWVTGAVSHPIFRASGLATDKRGFARIRSTLQFEEYDNLFGTGDCATLIDHPDTAKAGVYAVRQGPFITTNIRAVLSGTPLRTYTPQSDFLALLNLGDGTALGTKWGRAVQGRWVMRLKDWIDRRFMRRFQ